MDEFNKRFKTEDQGDLTDDEVRQATLAKRLSKALQLWLQKRTPGNKADHLSKNAACRIDENWQVMWRFIDSTKRGYLDFDDFEGMVHQVLHVRTGITTRDLKGVWDRCDTEKTGRVTAGVFAQELYNIYMKTWPVLSDRDLTRLVGVLSNRADKVHACKGNWYKVFNKIDADGNMEIDFNEFIGIVRRSYPGLSIPVADFDDGEIRGFWRACDSDYSGSLTVKEFMRFMRYHFGKTQKHVETPSSDGGDPLKFQPHIRLASKHEIRSIGNRLAKALKDWQDGRGHPPKEGKSTLADANLRWCLLFTFVDDGNRRINFDEFYKAITTVLRPKDLTEDELKVFFHMLDSNGGGEVSPEEFALAIYKLEVDWWPVIHDKDIKRIVRILNDAMIRWHFANTKRDFSTATISWTKVFSAQRVDGAPSLDYSETFGMDNHDMIDFNMFVGIVRNKVPGLFIKRRDLTDDEVKGIWKVIDVDRWGKVSKGEFLRFFRENSEHNGDAGEALTRQIKARSDTATAANYHTPRKLEAEDLKTLERGWVHQFPPSPSGILRQEDALRNRFRTEGDGKARPLHQPSGRVLGRLSRMGHHPYGMVDGKPPPEPFRLKTGEY